MISCRTETLGREYQLDGGGVVNKVLLCLIGPEIHLPIKLNGGLIPVIKQRLLMHANIASLWNCKYFHHKVKGA